MQTDQYPGFSAATVMPEGSAELPADGTTTSSLNSLFMPRLLRSSSLDGVLNKGDIKLEDLLDEEDFVYDLKNGNPKLLDYFAKNPGNIRNLIDYVTIMPPDPEDTKRAHKYPFVACEVFEADVAPIMNAFFFTHAQKASEGSPSGQSDKASLLEYLFTFLDTDKEINPVLAGYFNKVVQVLFKRNPRRMVEFVYEKEAYLMSMVNHLQEKSIAELISLFICYENSQTDESHQSRLGTKIKVLDKIFETLTKPADENYGEEASINAGHILNEIIQKHNAIIDGKELIKHIASSTTTQKLFDALKNADIAKITSVGDVLSGILKYYAPDAMDFGPSDSYGYGGQSEQEKVTQVISQNMDIFLSILLNEGKENKFETVFGSTVKSIGSGRLKIIEILEKIVKLDNMEIYDKVSDLNLLKIVTDLFNEAPWNNILHSIYEQLINTILDKADNTLFKALFEQANFLEIIIQAGQNPQHELPKRGRKVRKGYMGHVIRLANELVRYGNIDDTVEKYLKANRNWDNFVYNVLKKQNEINNTQIGGHNPRSLVGAPHMESSFGSLAESQPMMMPQSSESFAAMPSYEEEIMQGERSPNKAGDIGGSFQTPTFDWKESVGQSVDALVETIFRKTKNEFDLGRNPTLDRLGVEGIHEVKRHEDSEMAKSLFGNKENKEGRRSFGRNEDLGPKEDHDNRFPGGSPEKGTKNSLNSSPGKDHEKNASPDKQALSEEAKAELFKHLREKNPATAHMTQSAIARARKVKLKLKKGEKANPLKIFEAINKYKSSRDMSASTEFTFTESSMTDSRQMESEGAAVLEEEQREEVLAKLKEEENNKGQDNEANGVNGVKAEGSPQKVENSPEKST